MAKSITFLTVLHDRGQWAFNHGEVVWIQILSNICTIPMLVDRLAQQVMLQPTRNDAETIKVYFALGRE